MNRRTWTAVAALSLAAALTGCASEAETAAPVATIPSPDAAQTSELLEQLSSIDPALGRDSDVSDARNICQGLLAGEIETGDLVRPRLGDSLTDEQVGAIESAIRDTFCTVE
ncbi:hypothetical protein [Mycetocola reblochoni]|uniref:hypothetical protein n=1 Tax=Mycetocola reblochoni TaxID=331618 RepID=UPI003F98BEFA